jgi:hypothetical protein
VRNSKRSTLQVETKCYILRSNREHSGEVFHVDDKKIDGKWIPLTHPTLIDTTKRLMSSPKCMSVEVLNNPTKPGSNHKEVNYTNYK